MNNGIIRFTLCLLFFISAILGVPSGKAVEVFTDLSPVPWAEEAVYFLNDQDIIEGYGKGKFGPNNEITREQAALMLVRELYPNEKSFTQLPFSDVDEDSFYYNAIAVAVDHNLFEGFPNGEFKPKDPITRAATAKIFALAYDLHGSNADFQDLHKAPWAVDFIQALASNKIVNGYEDYTFRPNQTITRAEFSLSFARVLDDRFKPKTELTVHFLNVGQGDAILIQYPNGKTTLVDAGRYASTIDEALRAENITQIDTFIATHPDADHIGGAAYVIANYGVTKVIDSGQEHTTDTYFNYLNTVADVNAEFEVPQIGEDLSEDPNATAKVLFYDSYASDLNDGSIVIMLSYGLTDFLLTGDAGLEVEDFLMKNFDLEAEILKVSHHGSNTGTSGDFIEAVSPNEAILSFGDNGYGHPHDEVVNDLLAYDVNLYSTYKLGTITVETSGPTYSIEGNTVQWAKEPGADPVNPNPTSNQIKIIGKDLYNDVVTIKNNGSTDVKMQGWKLVSVQGNQEYEFPTDFTLNAGAEVRVTSGPDAVNRPPTHLKWTDAYIWRNSGDAAEIWNDKGVLIDEIR